MEGLQFFTEEIDFQLPSPDTTHLWIEGILTEHEVSVENVNFIFCSDEYLLEVNRSYLQHDYYTDIITFDNREYDDEPLESDIFISIDRVKDNAAGMGIPFLRELHRVIIHGLLHLIGWNDKTQAEKQAMREKEEACLSLHPDYQ